MNLLGEGGMGAVYLANDPELERQVALKVPFLDRDHSDTFLDRFQREAKAVASLQHPNICPVYEAAQVDGVRYMAMAFIDGQTLSALMGDRRPQNNGRGHIKAAVKLVCTLAGALEEAHQAGVIHRDLKPANIMIDHRGEPIVMDFGLARREGQPQLTTDGQMLGTPLYMPPEQVDGRAADMSPACDIYSLGMILYELLSGRRPFEGDLLWLLSQIAIKTPAPPSSHNARVDSELDAICLKAIEKKPEDRFASMAEFADALGRYLEGKSTHITGPATGKGAPASRRTFSPWHIVFAGVACGILAVCVWYAVSGSSSATPESGDNPSSIASGKDGPRKTAPVNVEQFDILVSRNDGPFHLVNGMLPLRNDDALRFVVRLSRPAHLRLIWIDAAGESSELYPHDPEKGDRGDEPVPAMESPIELNRGWPLEGEGGWETALLLVSDKPFGKETTVALRLPTDLGAGDRALRYTATRQTALARQTAADLRSLGGKSKQVNNSVLQLLESLRRQADQVQAISIPHAEE